MINVIICIFVQSLLFYGKRHKIRRWTSIIVFDSARQFCVCVCVSFQNVSVSLLFCFLSFSLFFGRTFITTLQNWCFQSSITINSNNCSSGEIFGKKGFFFQKEKNTMGVRVACNCVNGLTRTNGYSNNRQWHTRILFVAFISMLDAECISIVCHPFSGFVQVLGRWVIVMHFYLFNCYICFRFCLQKLFDTLSVIAIGPFGTFTSYAICLDEIIRHSLCNSGCIQFKYFLFAIVFHCQSNRIDRINICIKPILNEMIFLNKNIWLKP